MYQAAEQAMKQELGEQTRAWLEIDLDRLVTNVRIIREATRHDCHIMAVVKADGYGHGAAQIAPVLLDSGVDQLAVAFLDEAIELRQSGIEAPILILGHTDGSRVKALLDYRLMPTVYSCELAEALAHCAAQRSVRAPVHIKIDTGMSRIGFPMNEETIRQIRWIQDQPNLKIEGIFTHFPSADDPEPFYTRRPFDAFTTFCKQLEQAGVDLPLRHVCNSAASMRFPDMHLDMIRPGLILYGMVPKGCPEIWSGLQPVMSLKTRVIRTRTLPAGSSIGYGHETVLTRERTIATLGIGYADGYLRRLDRSAVVMIRGERAPLIGKICMDMCMVDVTDIDGGPVQSGEEVLLFGPYNHNDQQGLSVDTVAAWQNTINYEVTCIMGRRLPRIYIRNEEIVQIRNELHR